MDAQNQRYTEVAEMLKAAAHPVRLCILKNLAAQQKSGGPSANVTHMQSCLGIPQSTLSQHLQKLRAAGLVVGKRKGLEISYEIADPKIIQILACCFTDED